MVIDVIHSAVSNGLERVTSPFRETQENRARKVLRNTEALMIGRPIDHHETIDNYIDRRTVQLSRAIYRLAKVLPTHNESTDRAAKGLATFISLQVVIRRANSDNRPDIASKTQDQMSNSRLLPLKPPEESRIIGGEPIRGSAQAFEEKSAYLAQKLSAMSGVREDQQATAYATVCKDLEEAIADLSHRFLHTPRQ